MFVIQFGGTLGANPSRIRQYEGGEAHFVRAKRNTVKAQNTISR